MPLAIAKFTPSRYRPAARHIAAASPATSMPSPVIFGIIDSPASGIRWAEYSFTSPPSTSGAMAGWALRLAMISSGRSSCAPSLPSLSTTPTANVSRLVYRKPPPLTPEVPPRISMSTPSRSRTPKRSSITSFGSAIVSFTPRVVVGVDLAVEAGLLGEEAVHPVAGDHHAGAQVTVGTVGGDARDPLLPLAVVQQSRRRGG